MKIGLIGGIGPAATLFYYDRLSKAFAARGQDLELVIVNASTRTLTENVSAGRIKEQAQVFLAVAKQLAAAGADCVVISSMGGHFCIDEFEPVCPLPIIHGPRAVGDHLKRTGITNPGVLGTRVVMETGLYGFLKELNPVIPGTESIAQVHQDYIDMAMAGAPTADQRHRLLQAGNTLIDKQGASVILLGGTDLSLVYDENTDVPFIDTAQIHVDAIVAQALN